MAMRETITNLLFKPTKLKPAYKTGRGIFVLTGDTKTVTADGSVAALTIPAGVTVLQAMAEVVTSAGETCTVNLGIANGAEFASALNLNRTAGLISAGPSGAGGVNAGMKFTAEDNIDATVTLNGGTGSVAFKVHAVCFKH